MKSFLCCFFVTIAALGQLDITTSESLLKKGHFLAAEKLMIPYVLKHPQDLNGIELLGDAFGHQKKWDEAIQQYEKLVQISPNTANYHYKYGGAAGMKALSVNKLKALAIIGDVKQAFLTAAELDPQHIETRWALVELYMKLPIIIGGSKSSALSYAEELQHLSKVDGFLAKGFIYEYNKDYKRAEHYYKEAIKEGESLVCYDKLTKLYLLENRPEYAIRSIETALAKHDDNSLHYQIGKTAAENNLQLQKGAEHLKIYVKNYMVKDEVPPAWAHYYLAQIYKLQSKKTEALKYIELALSDLPKNERFKKERVAILSRL